MEKKEINKTNRPEILAPAGNIASFFAAVAAGADAVYCGLKNFSARMEADNFSIEELARMKQFAADHDVRLYIAINTLLKPDDLPKAANLVDKLKRHVKPDALIVSDPGMIQIAEQTGFKGEIHISTLANASHPSGIKWLKETFNISRVVMPRELNIDEIRQMADASPDDCELEAFIHGALCYAVSGRCYWSSYLGGKSGLRGRCVQPCRRIYTGKGEPKRHFSCQDFSLDVLVKVLKEIPKVTTWKIEGRKKGPHYVYYTVKAYQMLRDQGNDPQIKRAATGLLEQALGRPSTHYGFLPQRPQNPVDTSQQTGSGLFMGVLKGPRSNPWFSPRQDLIKGDLLRVGYEDSLGHQIVKVYKPVPKKGRLHINVKGNRKPDKNSPVFLIDRREEELTRIIRNYETELELIPPVTVKASEFNFRLPSKKKGRKKNPPASETILHRKPPQKVRPSDSLWLTSETIDKLPSRFIRPCFWWLPPVIWPDKEQEIADLIRRSMKKGAFRFVLNAPTQMAFFEKQKGLELWAGPFCNLSNAAAINLLAEKGFNGAIVSPELTGEDYLALPAGATIPLGIILSGNWPLAVSRTLSPEIKPGIPFTSPKGEPSWAAKYGSDYWIFPGWQSDISKHRGKLEKAGYSTFIHIRETIPKPIRMKKREGEWNWNLRLL